MDKGVKNEAMDKVYKEFTRQKYNKYKTQFPKLQESEIISKIIKAWDSLENVAKDNLKQIYERKNYLTYEDISFEALVKAKNISQNKNIMKQQQADTTVEKLQQKEDVELDQCFTYEFFQANRYKISQTDKYQAICNNGFIKLYTKLCRVYWHTQNEFSHEVNDWKFHISVTNKDIKKAWNLVASLFIKMKCRAGMKTNYIKQSQRPQKGRQITLYLIKYDPIFKDSAFAGDFGLDIDVEHSEDYWFQLCKSIEKILSLHEIESNGLADGDFPLGKYVSLRNQAFVRNYIGQSIYPPNDKGWNPLNQKVPIDLQRFRTIKFYEDKQQSFTNRYRSIIFIGFTLLTVGLLIKFQFNPWKK